MRRLIAFSAVTLSVFVGCAGAPAADVGSQSEALALPAVQVELQGAGQPGAAAPVADLLDSDVLVVKVATAGERKYADSALGVDVTGTSNWIDASTEDQQHAGLKFTIANPTAEAATIESFIAKFVCDTRPDPNFQGRSVEPFLLEPFHQITHTWDCTDAPFHASDVIVNVTISRD